MKNTGNKPSHEGSRGGVHARGQPPSRNASLESRDNELVSPGTLSVQQLEALLADRRLMEEQDLLPSDATISPVTATERKDPVAVGPSVYMEVMIGGVTVDAMVDTGAQSTIISRELLHKITRHLRGVGKSPPQLEKPSARLYGKDGVGGGRELVVTAQLTIPIEADGESACVPVFVQPESSQACLLGMNALPALGFTLLRANGEALVTKAGTDTKIARVRLVQSTTIPSLKGSFVKVEVEDPKGLTPGSSVLFEPTMDQLEPLGLHSHESLVTMAEDGSMLIPLLNPQGTSAQLEGGAEVGVARCVSSACVSTGLGQPLCDNPSGLCAKVGAVPQTPE